MDLVSIIIPVYNSAEFLQLCLDSVVNQTYKNIEVIIINDGSYDNSGKICEEYANRDSRIKLIHKQNGGVSESRNVGIEISTGKWICFIDSDDTVELDYVAELLKPTLIEDYDLVICNINDVYKNCTYKRKVDGLLTGDFYKDYYVLYRLTRVPVIKLYKSEIVKKEKIAFPEDVFYLEDQIFNFKYFEFVNKYHFIDRPLYNYYHRKNSSLSQKITLKAFNGNLLKLQYASSFYKKNKIKQASDLLNRQVLFCIDKFAKLTDSNDNYLSFKDRVKLLKKYIDFDELTNSRKRKIALFLLRNDIVFPFYVKAYLKKICK